MNIKLPSGKYVVAVSGGVDSVVLLDLLAKKPGIEIVVAHFDHGIRADSAADESSVRSLAKKCGYKYYSAKGELGSSVSEEAARDARYHFLKKTLKEVKADAIITAHHQDDVIETALINVLRGTGSAGLASLKSTDIIKRPLLTYSKEKLLDYAKKHNLRWREDKSNQDIRYLRNHLRLEVIPRMKNSQRTQLLRNIDKVAEINDDKHKYLATLSQYIEEDNKIKRSVYSLLENKIAQEYLYEKLCEFGEIDRKTVSRINIAIKTVNPGSKTNIIADKFLVANKDFAWFE